MATLTGELISETYDSLLKVTDNNTITGIKKRITELRQSGLTCEEISKQEKMKISNVYRYSADVDITPKGKNNPVYFDEFSLEKCLRKIK